ncbi:GNAT family N-acetyltransferase [Enterocloster citroniae]
MKLVKIDITSDRQLIQEYIDMYLNLMNLHYEAAALQGILDIECEKKTNKDAIEKLKNEDLQIELLCDHAEVIGFVRYGADNTETQNMVTDDENTGIHISQLYIKRAWRKMGYGTYIIQTLKERNNKISLDCYYSLEANTFYQKMGFKPVITTYLSY